MKFSSILKSITMFKLLILFLLLCSLNTHAQQIQVTGKVTDSLQNPLGYANIIAMPEAAVDALINPRF